MLQRVVITLILSTFSLSTLGPQTQPVRPARKTYQLDVVKKNPTIHRDSPAVTRRRHLCGPRCELVQALRSPGAFSRWKEWLFWLAYHQWLASLPAPPTQWGAPTPWSDNRCPAGPIKDEIDNVFGIASPWAESIAVRESGCSPQAYNPSGAEGIFQLLGHQDILNAVCPPYGDWANFDCNIRAAYSLFAADGIAPWRL